MKPVTTLVAAGVMSLAMVSANAAEKLKMATIAPGTSAYLTMTTFANIVNKNQKGYEFTVDATGAATKHIIEVARGKLDYAMSSPTIHFFLKNGKAMYKKLKDGPKLAEKLSLVMWFPYGQYHFIVHEDSGIKTLSDLKGKRVFLGPPGGGAWNAAYSWMKLVGGLDAKKGDFESVKASWSSAFQGFQDRQFDAYVNGGIAPFPQVEQLSLTSEIRLLGVDKASYESNDAAEKYMSGVPGRDLGVIKQGTYGKNVKMDHDIYTNGATVGITVRKEASEEQVYQVTKAFWENIGAAQKSAPWMKNITMEYAIKEGGLALHPGAQRYYKEAGVEIPAGSMTK